VRIGPSVAPETADLLFDPQTSGGLLFAVAHASHRAAQDALASAGVAAAVIGLVEESADVLISVH
jgi:selenide,water dikinase